MFIVLVNIISCKDSLICYITNQNMARKDRFLMKGHSRATRHLLEHSEKSYELKILEQNNPMLKIL